ncbi:hypothetical protein [Kineococcus sp. SYSU DK003]|uniref:hypothetical protein n=1 Tax=Kineococcus sp. SYSU DK003 TaxID=3383124 RepID=UPI003D7EB6FF
MRRTWVSIADLVLSVLLLVAAALAVVESRWAEAVLALVLSGVWAATAWWRAGRRVRVPAVAPAPVERTRPTG